MRTPEGPKWGTRSVERWIKKTVAEMKRGEVQRVTFEGVWRGGVKRRLLTNEQGRFHRAACERAMKRSEEWEPPFDRIQARLWSADKRYLSSLTWQIGSRPRPRPLQRGETPQRRAEQASKGAGSSSPVGVESVAFRSAVEKRLQQLESASAPPASGQLRSLQRRLEAAEARLVTVEKENRQLREAVSVVWNDLSGPVMADLYLRLQALHGHFGLQWTLPKDTLDLPEKWPNEPSK